MSDQPPAVPAKVLEDQQYFPPPPGPPPGYVPQTQVPQSTIPPANTAQPAVPATQVPPLQVPPPNTAPSHSQQPGVSKHTNETPLPEYPVPHFGLPPRTESDLYDATPTDEHPPPFPPRPTSSGKEEGKKHKRDWSQKLTEWGNKAAVPFNALANKMGSESFLPTTLDKECEKAARILRSFAKDGIYSDTTPPTAPGAPTGSAPSSPTQTEAPKAKKPKVLLTIPSKVIARAQGLAIFTTARAGFQVSGATGSGILIARLPDGSWSPPSGIQVHSVGAGFVIGLDIYDCVVVINTREALEAFTRTRLSLGSDLAVTAGPWGVGGALDFGTGVPQSQKGKDKAPVADNPAPLQPQQQQQPPLLVPPYTEFQPPTSPQDNDPDAPPSLPPRKPSPFREAIKNPVYSYVKSRGFYAGVQIDGTVVTERKDANAAFYGVPVSVHKILRGEVMAHGPAGMWPDASRGLFEVLKGAEGWRGQQGGPQGPHGPPPSNVGFPPPATAAAAPGTRDLAGGMQGLNLGAGSAGAGPSTSFGGGPAPPPPQMTAAEAKAAEAAAEAAKYPPEPYVAPPPLYSDPVAGGSTAGTSDLPPAYVEDGQYRPGMGDSKTGQH